MPISDGRAALLANIAALPGRTAFVAAHRAKAREFATMRLRVVWRGWGGEVQR